MASTQEPIRFASFNASLNRGSEGQLVTDLSTETNTQAQNVAEIIQRVNPDIVLINEFDYDADGQAAQLFQQNYLSVSQNEAAPVEYEYKYVAPSNTGIASGFDLNNNGSVVTTPGEPGYGDDALGFGNFPGQYGMALYSKYEIDFDNIRTFQNFLWKDMPGALLPDDPATPEPNDWYLPEELEIFRLSSKNHWDIPIYVNGEVVHLLLSHPTPPTFDGAEDRNGRRNHDEIRLWADYITPGAGYYIYDDEGNYGGLAPGSRFVIMGDQNADPVDGDSTDDAILQLLDNSLINTTVTPASEGGADAAARQGGANDNQSGNPAFDTADFADTAPGNLRVDYVLPSQNLEVADTAVFWPKNDDPLFRLVGEFDPSVPGGFPSSDHRLVWADVEVDPTTPDVSQKTVTDLEFLGEVTFNTGLEFAGTQVGGLSGITYDPFNNVYYSISDDRSQLAPARFYTLSIDLSDGALQNGDVTFQDVTTLLDEVGEPFPANSLDPEGIALTSNSTLFVSSEGDTSLLTNPFVNQFSLQGQQFQELPVPENFLPTADGTSGIRNNLAFESLTVTPNGQYLFTATENALYQDGPEASLESGSPSRIIKYNLLTNEVDQEFVYYTDPVAADSIPPGGFVTNGLVELLAIDNNGTLLALERSFSVGVGNTIKLYQVQTQGALDVSSVDAFDGLEIDPSVEKRLLLDFADLGIPLDNIEGMTFGPKLADGRQSLVVVSDNNFSATQFTQVLAFAVDLDTTPGVLPDLETPPVVDLDEPPNNNPPGDADDPAIYINPTDPSLSLVISTLKDGGLAVYDLNGETLQTILPGEPGDVRYNNVDLVYGFNLGSQNVDLAIASDRENDTLAIFQIDPTTRQLTDITSEGITGSIFGIDDGEQTAYGLATYTSPVSGKTYVFVSQRETGDVAQLELFDSGSGEINVRYVRTLTLPVPAGGELADAQVEGMVADRELGYLYVGQENVGIWKFSTDPASSDTGVLIDSVSGNNLEADVEGLTIYYADDGKGYLLASSQGDNSFAVYSREGNNEYLGNFVIGESGDIDGVQESDGADVINVPLGPEFPSGLLVVQDGSNDPATVIEDDGQLENASSNFKFVPWESVANAFPNPLTIDTTSFNPRNPLNVVNGTADADGLNGTTGGDRINGFQGNDSITGLQGDDQLTGGGERDTFVINRGDGSDTVTDFGGIGTGGNPSTATIAEVDTIKFQGEGLTVENLLLTQDGSDLEISFVDVNDTQVILEDFQLENLDNIKSKDASVRVGNILFDGQNRIQDSFDVFNADWQRERVLNRNRVTFLNDLDNDTEGFNSSKDVVNGQIGNDTLDGLSGDDLLRGGTGNDLLLGGIGQDRLFGDDNNDTLLGQRGRDFLVGGNGNDLLNGSSSRDTLQGQAGEDTLVGGSGNDLFILRADQGTDAIDDFQNQQDRIGLAGGLTFGQIAIAQGSGSNANDTVISVLGQNLAILTGVQSSSLDSNDFILA